MLVNRGIAQSTHPKEDKFIDKHSTCFFQINWLSMVSPRNLVFSLMVHLGKFSSQNGDLSSELMGMQDGADML
ncbi:hypothetical protein Trydic_g19757 [Trypoxylus dichotomus]